MIKNKFQIVVISIVSLFSYTAIRAQELNFSGRWNINLNKSKLNKTEILMMVPVIKIRQKPTQISILRIVADSLLKESRSLEIFPQGVTQIESVIEHSRKKTSTISFSPDYKTLVQSSRYEWFDKAKKDYLATDSLTLSSDNKSIYFTRALMINGRFYIIKAIYDKK